MSGQTPTVTLYTDGSCKGNPGPGGYAAVLRTGQHERMLCGWEPETTNNRMELLAVIVSLEALTKPCQVELFSDSKYVIAGMTEWLPNWKRRGWKKVKNVDLWQRLEQAAKEHTINWRWVRGHSGDPGNEKVDKIASHCASAQAAPSEDFS